MEGRAHSRGRGSGRGSGSGRAAGQSSTQLEFTQAMTDFKVMFPNMDADVIEAVLRANNGAVDATIDNLLAMSADNDDSGAEKGKGGNPADIPPDYPPSSNPPSYLQATQDGEDLINLDGAFGGGAESVANSATGATPKTDHVTPAGAAGGATQGLDKMPIDLLSELDTIGASAAGASKPAPEPSSIKQAYSHPERQQEERDLAQSEPASIVPTQQMLQDRYEENLRRREEVRTAFGPAGAEEKDAQFLEDERLALMMQNEEFMAELRGDTDFLYELAREQGDMDERDFVARERIPEHGAGSGHGAATRGRSMISMDEAQFREKLKNMGKTSKRKFTQLAGMFSSRRKGSGAKQLLGQGPAPSKDNLLLNDEPLVNPDADSDSEDDGSKKRTPTKGKYTSFS